MALATGESRVYGLSSGGAVFALSSGSAAVELQAPVAGAECLAVRRALLACGTGTGSVHLLRASTLERLVRHSLAVPVLETSLEAARHGSKYTTYTSK